MKVTVTKVELKMSNLDICQLMCIDPDEKMLRRITATLKKNGRFEKPKGMTRKDRDLCEATWYTLFSYHGEDMFYVSDNAILGFADACKAAKSNLSPYIEVPAVISC